LLNSKSNIYTTKQNPGPNGEKPAVGGPLPLQQPYFLSDKPCGATGMKENKIKLVICIYRVIVENQQHISMIVFQISFITMK
jgi:hypothetical protein